MIKGGLFLKSLKQLFIISLISCFILLGSSFVSASCYGPASSSSVDNRIECDNVSYNYIYKGVGSISDYKFNFTDGIFQYKIDNNNILSYWWQGKYLNYTYKNGNNSSNGIIDGFFYFNSTVGNDVSVYLKNRGSIIPFSDLGNYLDNTYQYVDYYCGIIKSSSLPNCIVCLTQGSDLGHICVDLSDVSVRNNSYISTDNIIFSSNPFFGGGTAFVPSTGSRLGGRLLTSSGYTNNQMVEAYECVGLQPYLCYGGFPINNIFYPSEGFADFTGYIAGQGATIFDLYNLYSSSFSSMDQFLNSVLVWTRNQQIDNFLNKPKALLMFGNQLDLAGFKTSYVSTYCDLLLNRNNNSIYTGQSVDDLRAQSCYRSQHINDSLKNFDGSDTIGQGSDVGIFGSGDDVDFDPETFFSNMMEKISSGLDKVSTGTAVGVIPGYIVLFTLALIFIRLISH